MEQALIVEDEPAIAESVAYALERGGFETQIALSLKAAREHLSASTNLLILDLNLPDGSGFELLEEIPTNFPGLSVIVLSSRNHEDDRIRALENGADDYVTKPFSPREVVARAKAVLRRTQQLPPKPQSDLPIFVDPAGRTTTVNGKEIEITRVEFDILQLLIGGVNQVFSRANMIDTIWGPGFALSDRTIDSHIKALRRKIGEAGGSPDWIETIRGIGYRLRFDETSSSDDG